MDKKLFRTLQGLLNINGVNMSSIALRSIRHIGQMHFHHYNTRSLSSEIKEMVSLKLEEQFRNDVEKKLVVPIFKRALLYDEQIALKDSIGQYSYLELFLNAKKLSYQVSNICGSAACTNVGYFCSKNVLSPTVLWACWISGQVAMPICGDYSNEHLKYQLTDAETKLLIATSEYEEVAENLAKQLNLPIIILDHSFLSTKDDIAIKKLKAVLTANNTIMIEGTLSNDFYTDANAMLLYCTRGDGKPRGVLLSYKHLDARLKSMAEVWKISATDHFLHVLPLSHVDGTMDSLLLPLSVGAKITMHPTADSQNIWKALLGINMPVKERVNVLMAVPTIYSQLLIDYDNIFYKDSKMVEYIKNYCKEFIRLMLSGSAAMPEQTLNRWLDITGHNLFECYGTTETGKVLSNAYIQCDATKPRRRLHGVGTPLPTVKVRIVNSKNELLFENDSNIGKENSYLKPIVGELLVSGPSVFKQYINHPDQDINIFSDGYFKTGHIVKFENEHFSILGQMYTDIINMNGFSVSCLQVESAILTHPSVLDVVVLGVPDDKLAEQIYAICTLKQNSSLDLDALKQHCCKFLQIHELPTRLKVVNEIPESTQLKSLKTKLRSLLVENTNETITLR